MKALLAILGQWIGAAWRNRWTFLVPVATLLLPAAIYAVSLADLWEAKAIVHVRPLSTGEVGSGLPQEQADRPDEVMPTVRDRIFTRGNLESVVPILIPDAQGNADPLILEGMAKSFAWEQTASTVFEVTHKGTDPVASADAVNRLLETFLEGERQDRQRRAERNLTFHEGELDKARKEYREKSDELAHLRAEHEDTLPERKDAIQGELARLQMQIATQMGLESAARQRVQMLEDQLITLNDQPVFNGPTRISAIEESLQLQMAEENRALNALEQELASALATRTDRHPDVIRLRSAVSVHQEAVKQTTLELDRVRRAAQANQTETVESQLARRRKSLLDQRKTAEATVERTAGVVSSLSERVLELQRNLAGIPATRDLLEPAHRDLEQAGKRLEAMEGAAGQARAHADFYRTRDLTDVTGFRVSAWAVVPVQPSGPGRARLLLTALVLGLLSGYGLLLLKRRHEGGTILSAGDLQGLFPSAVMVNIPLLGAGRRNPWPQRLVELGLTAYVGVLLLATVWFLAAHKGWLDKPSWMLDLLGGSA